MGELLIRSLNSLSSNPTSIIHTQVRKYTYIYIHNNI